MWVTEIQIVVGALRGKSGGIGRRIETLQTTALLRSARDLMRLGLNQNPVKNHQQTLM